MLSILPHSQVKEGIASQPSLAFAGLQIKQAKQNLSKGEL